MEFNSQLVPEIKFLLDKTNDHPQSLLTDSYILNGTTEKVKLFLTPLLGSDGSKLGVCGFEISESYFKNYFAQPTNFEQLTCLFSKSNENGVINCDNAFWTGVLGGYFLKPSGLLTPKPLSKDLVVLNGDNSYVALCNSIDVCGESFTITVMQAKSTFDNTVAINITRVVLLCILLVFATAVLCVVFSRRFVAPVIKSLENIRKQEQARAHSNIIEIADLFVYLADQDKLREQQTDELKRQNSELASMTESQLAEIDRQQAEINRLSYSRKTEIDPDDYQTFKAGLKELTKTEKNIFELYLEGKSAAKIVKLLNIRESTLKFHNHNILDKLGVSSRKHMLRYATLLKQENQN